ncbi:MAG: tetratricopeptide repeat protein [Chloroflexota bacterium]
MGYNTHMPPRLKRCLWVQYPVILATIILLLVVPRWLEGQSNLQQARMWITDGEHSLAAGALEAAAKRLPWEDSLWQQAGSSALEGGDTAEAIRLFEQARHRGQLSLDGWVVLGDLYTEQGDPVRAIETWSEAMSLFKTGSLLGDPGPLLNRLVDVAHQEDNFVSEEALLGDWLAADPQAAYAHYRLGLVLSLTDPDRALDEILLATSLDPELDAPVQAMRLALSSALSTDDRAYQMLITGRGLANLSEWGLAREAFRQALEMDNSYGEAWAWLGEAEQQLGGDGFAHLQRAIFLAPDSAMVQVLVGLYWQREGEMSLAITTYRNAVALEPFNPAWQLTLAGAYEGAGDLISALEHYSLATDLGPGEAIYWRMLAVFCLRNGVELMPTGVPAARRLVVLAPDDWLSHDIAGQIWLDSGNLTQALDEFQRAIELDPSQAAPYLHLGVLYLQTGDRQKAFDHLVNTHRLEPHGPLGVQAQRLLDQYFP